VYGKCHTPKWQCLGFVSLFWQFIPSAKPSPSAPTTQIQKTRPMNDKENDKTRKQVNVPIEI
jgi:hypothetical protein